MKQKSIGAFCSGSKAGAAGSAKATAKVSEPKPSKEEPVRDQVIEKSPPKHHVLYVMMVEDVCRKTKLHRLTVARSLRASASAGQSSKMMTMMSGFKEPARPGKQMKMSRASRKMSLRGTLLHVQRR